MKTLARLASTLALVAGPAGLARAEIVPIWWNTLYYQKDAEYLVLTSHGSVAPTDPGYPTQVATIASHGVRYARVWTMCGTVPDHRPWQVHWDLEAGEWVFDLGVWNDAYWADFRQALSLARENNIALEVHLFDRSGIGWDPDHINPCSGGNGLFSSDYAYWFQGPGLAYLEDFVDKLIAESFEFDNVIYEVDQESRIGDPAWHAHWAAGVRARLESHGVNRDRVVAISPPDSAIGVLGGWNLHDVDTINLHIPDNPQPGYTIDQMVSYLQGKQARIRSTRSATGKAVSYDEFGNGMANEDHLRMMAWTFLASGAHFHIEDADETAAFNVAGAVERWKGSAYWEFWHYATSDEPIVSGGLTRFCMRGDWPANGYREYLCYVPTVPLGSTTIGMTLPQPPAGFGGWAADVWNPRDVDAGVSATFYSSTPTSLTAGLPSTDQNAFKRDWLLAVYAIAGPSYRLSVTHGGAGDGTVTSSPAGIDCGADCTQDYITGTLVTLSASPAAGSRFMRWEGDCSGTACQVTMSQPRSVSAVFEPLPRYPLTVTLAGGGTGTVTSSPPGISCGTDCSESYSLGTVVRLTQTPGPASAFAGWSGACSGMEASCLVTIDDARSVTATFTPFSGLLYNPLPLPCRVVDTRGGSPLVNGQPVTMQVTGLCGIPAGAQAVAAMVAAVNPTSPGHVTMNLPARTTAVANFPLPANAWASSAVVSLSAGGAVTTAAYLTDAGTTHLVMDVSGYFGSASLGGQSYQPLVPPARFLDTRPTDDPLSAATERVYPTAGFGGLTATATALAVSAAVVGAKGDGHLKLYPADRGIPATSFLNYRVNDQLDNGGIVAVSGSTGRLAAWSAKATHLILDVHGAFVPAPARRYFPITPCRVIDTRATGQRFSGSFTFAVGGTCGIPADAAAVAANLAVVNPSALGHLTLTPAGYTPLVSQLLFQPGWTISSGALVSLGTGGLVTALTPATTDLLVDVTGYFR